MKYKITYNNKDYYAASTAKDTAFTYYAKSGETWTPTTTDTVTLTSDATVTS